MTAWSLENWLGDYPWVRARFLEQCDADADECGRELGRFFALTQLTDEPLAVISQFTESYGAFCEGALGRLLHHRSRTEFSPVPDRAVRNFFEAYKAQFGAVPSIWIEDADPQLVAFARGEVEQIPAAVAWSGWPGARANPL